MPIPPASTAVHHITDEMVADKPLFKDVARNIAKVFEGADIAGFNSNRFDVPLLIEELLRAGVNLDISKRKFVDVQTIYHIMEPRTLKAAYKFYCGAPLVDAHSALADTRATYEVFKAQLDRYTEEMKEEYEDLAVVCYVNSTAALKAVSDVCVTSSLFLMSTMWLYLISGNTKGVPLRKFFN